jgi:sec-independent protein translocase protein TatA
MTVGLLLGFLGGLGTGEIVILVLVILLLFGAKRIPDLARGFGKGIKEFKDARNGVDAEKQENKDKL